MLLRRLTPKANYALFFPTLRKVVIGQRETVWLWQDYEFHQVELGEFFIVIEYGSNKSLEAARSADGLLFSIRVLFEVAVDTSLGALQKATRTRTAGRDINIAITHNQFKERLMTSLGTDVTAALKGLEYLSDETTDFKTSLEVQIEESARKKLANEEGFVLRRCVVLEVMPEKPNDHTLAQSPPLEGKWNAYQTKLTSIGDAEKIRQELIATAEKRRLRQAQEQEDKENADAEVRRKILLNKRDEELDIEAGKAETTKLERNEGLAKRRLENAKAQEAVKQELTKAQQQTELLAAQEVARVQAEKRTIEEAGRIAQDEVALKRLNAERKLLEQELNLTGLTLVDLRQKSAEGQVAIASQRAKELETVGAGEATVTRLKALAANAQSLQLNHELLEALPKILQVGTGNAATPTEMKVMYIGGQPGSPGISDGNIGSLLSTASSVSVLREILRFLGEWPGTPASNEAPKR